MFFSAPGESDKKWSKLKQAILTSYSFFLMRQGLGVVLGAQIMDCIDTRIVLQSE